MTKRKVLIIGNGPLPEDNENSRPAAGLRTSQFLKGLSGLLDRTDVVFEFCVVIVGIGENDQLEQLPFDQSKLTDEQRISLSKNNPKLQSNVQAICKRFEPDCIVAVNTLSSLIACKLKTDAPIWADLNGWIMAESQAQAFKRENDDYFAHYLELEKKIIKRADKISTVSKRQADALLGELAMMGRLNSKTFEYNFLEYIPNATEWLEGEKGAEKSKKIPEKGYKLLWLGGYNTWVDEQTLFKGVEGAMREDDKILYVSTGGALKGLDTQTFENFKSLVELSEFKERFVFLGWVETAEIAGIYKAVDVGLNVDRMCTETVTGARNRINEMMKFGLPIISTLGSEISYKMNDVNAGIGVKSGDAKGLTEAILKMKEDSSEFGKNGQRYVTKNCNHQKTTIDLVDWVLNPQAAPDRDLNMNGGLSGKIKAGMSYLKENGLKKFFIKLWQKIR